MGRLDTYFEQAKALSEDRQRELEAVLARFLDDPGWALTPEQEIELKKRLSEPVGKTREWKAVMADLGWKAGG